MNNNRFSNQVFDRQTRVERTEGILKNHPHFLTQVFHLLAVELGYIYPVAVRFVEENLAVSRVIKAQQRPADGGLATAAFANQPHHLLLPQFKRYPVHRFNRADLPLEHPLAERKVHLEALDFQDQVIAIRFCHLSVTPA